MYVFIWTVICVCLLRIDFTHAEDAKGAEYSEDTLIGRQTLFDNGNQLVKSGSNQYHIALLAVEGATDNYNLGDGFFLGFQWYNDMYDQQLTYTVNLQLYRLNNLNSSDQFQGSYTLVNETGFLQTKAGLNSFYFDEGIRFDTSDSINDSYYIAIMMALEGNVPVLFDMPTNCVGQSNVVVEAFVYTNPNIGDSIQFTRDTNAFSLLECASFSLQGIFLKTHLASQNSGNCSLHIAMKDHETPLVLTSHTLYIGDGLPSGSNVCQIVRAENPEYVIKINNNVFDLPGTGSGSECLNELLQIGDQKLLSDPNFNQWGSYCGSDIFSSKQSSNPYVTFNLMTSSSSPSGFKGYKFSITADEENGRRGLIIGLSVGLGILALFIICCICIACKSAKGGKKKSAGDKTGSSSNSKQSSQVQPYPTHKPNNRLPPLQNANEKHGQHGSVNQGGNQQGQYGNVNQQGQYGNVNQQGQYGNVYQQGQFVNVNQGGNQHIVSIPPPAYGTVMPQQNTHNSLPPEQYDPYGVPLPPVYIPPKY